MREFVFKKLAKRLIRLRSAQHQDPGLSHMPGWGRSFWTIALTALARCAPRKLFLKDLISARGWPG
jgi:hypothetical protein